jgi:ABC-type cobalt transport system substrate-binding protein
MRVSFEGSDEKVTFRISEFHPKYERILQMCFYENDGKGYTKIYPKNVKYNSGNRY